MSDGTRQARRRGADDPNTLRLSRAVSDELLDGKDGPAALRRLLDAATRTGSPAELHGEHAARAAFVAAARSQPPTSDPAAATTTTGARRWRRFVIGKAVAVIALTAGAGGVAVAATSTGLPAEPPAATTTRAPTPLPIAPTPVTDGRPAPGIGPVPDARTGPGNDSAATKSDESTRKCRSTLANGSDPDGGGNAGSDPDGRCATNAPDDPPPPAIAAIPETGPTDAATPGSSRRSDEERGHADDPKEKPDHPTKSAAADKTSKKPEPGRGASEAATGQVGNAPSSKQK